MSTKVTSLRLTLVTSASVLAFYAAPALAQDAQTAAVEEEAVEEIIVTASKRSSTLQDTPISVAVASKQAIEQSHVRDLIDLQSLVPSLKVGQLQSSANTNFIIRGFGNGANNAGIEPSVGVFIDGVYRSRSAAQIGDLPNIERVEVLRGPQSTLFGKNASAGIISIVTAEPKFDVGGTAEASYGNFNAIIVKADVTGPLSETVAASLSGSYNNQDGYARDVIRGAESNNRNRYGVRGQLLFKPTDDLKIRLIADYDKIDEICCTVVNVFDGPTGGAVRALGGRVLSNDRFTHNFATNFDSFSKIENYGGSAQVDWKFGGNLSLVSISAYRHVSNEGDADSDFTSADLIGRNSGKTSINTYTQEARITSDYDGFFNFLLGGFYFNEDITIDSALTFGRDFRGYANLLSGGAYGGLEPTLRALLGLPASTPATMFGAQGQGRFEHYDYKNTAFSIFGQGDFAISDDLTFTAGFNYTEDRKTAATNNTSTDVFSSLDLVLAGVRAGVPATVAATAANPFLGLRGLQFLPQFLNLPNAVESGKTKDDDLSYTLRLAYKFNPNISTYATYATGFKATSFNLSTDSRPTAANFIPGSPAQVPAPAASPIRTALGANLPVNLTTGTRFAAPENAEVFELGLKGNFDGFAINVAAFKQILKNFQSNIFQGTGFVLGNAEKQSTTGIEIDASVTPVRGLTFTASGTYLNPKFNLFTGGSAFNPATNNVVPTNRTGQRPTGISTYSVAVGGTYTHVVNDDLKAIFHSDFTFDSAYTIAAGLPFKASPENLNASITLQFRNSIDLTLWGRNLTEPKFNPVIFPTVAQSGSLSGYPSGPKTYGGSIRYRF